jgi:AdoMet-dependent heme synthase
MGSDASTTMKASDGGVFGDAPATVVMRLAALNGADRDTLRRPEAMRLLDDVRRFGAPDLVLQAGATAALDHLASLVTHATTLGLPVSLRMPSATLGRDAIEELRDAGLAELHVRLGGSSHEAHEVGAHAPGSYVQILRALEDARRLGLKTRAETPINHRTLPDLDALTRLLSGLGVSAWQVSFPVRVTDPQPGDLVAAEEFEAALQRLFELALEAPFTIDSADAPHFRRVLAQRRPAGKRKEAPGHASGRAEIDGNGVVFVSPTGAIQPSRHLALEAGNVRIDDVVQVYRSSPLFKALRDSRRLKGKCGVCEFRTVCGGSRARAFAATGDPLQADPGCVHMPVRWTRSRRRRAPGPDAIPRTGSDSSEDTARAAPLSLREFLCSPPASEGERSG